MIQVEDFHGVRALRMARDILGRGLYRTAAYWVDGLLIDTGARSVSREFREATEGLPIAGVVNTHWHEDHCGNNGLLQRRRGVKILAHPLALPYLARPRLMELQLYRRFVWGYPLPSQAEAVGPSIATRRHRFQVISTPGHSPDHVSLYEPERGWLFSGDAYAGGLSPVFCRDFNVYQIIASLKTLAGLRARFLFTGSGHVVEGPERALEAKIAYLEEAREKVLRSYKEGWDLQEISRRALGGEHWIRLVTLGHFSVANLVRAFLEDPESPVRARESG
jgi:glyoxylase-like metal-dependent hydrolase (beta-lactamase superfamily II)